MIYRLLKVSCNDISYPLFHIRCEDNAFYRNRKVYIIISLDRDLRSGEISLWMRCQYWCDSLSSSSVVRGALFILRHTYQIYASTNGTRIET